jgi:hypothetical protein
MPPIESPPERSARCWPLRVIAAVLLVALSALPARAGIIVSIQPVSAPQGSPDSTFEVDLQNNSGTDITVAAFAFQVSVDLASGITLTSAYDNPTVQTYIFDGHSFGGPEIDAGPGTTLDASDTSDQLSLGTLIPIGATVALGLVHFSVSAGAPLGADIVTLNYANLSGVFPGFADIPVDTLNNGSITVTSGTVVPEPSSLTLGCGMFLTLGGYLGWKRKADRRATPIA